MAASGVSRGWPRGADQGMRVKKVEVAVGSIR